MPDSWKSSKIRGMDTYKNEILWMWISERKECQDSAEEGSIVSSINGAGQLDIQMQKNEVGPLPHIIFKN